MKKTGTKSSAKSKKRPVAKAVQRKSAKPAATAKAAPRAEAKPAVKTAVATYTPQPIQGMGWAPFRYPRS